MDIFENIISTLDSVLDTKRQRYITSGILLSVSTLWRFTKMSRISGFITFVLGAAFGVFVTRRYFKKKYEQIAQEEIDSVKEVLLSVKNAVCEELDEYSEPNENEQEYSAILSREKYSSCANTRDEKTYDKSYVISPDEFGEKTGYDIISLTYYADGILADDSDAIVEDTEDTVGFDSLNHFGEYEDDSVFVRNDDRECYYEILLDSKKYTDVVKNKPYLNMED